MNLASALKHFMIFFVVSLEYFPSSPVMALLHLIMLSGPYLQLTALRRLMLSGPYLKLTALRWLMLSGPYLQLTALRRLMLPGQ